MQKQMNCEFFLLTLNDVRHQKSSTGVTTRETSTGQILSHLQRKQVPERKQPFKHMQETCEDLSEWKNRHVLTWSAPPELESDQGGNISQQTEELCVWALDTHTTLWDLQQGYVCIQLAWKCQRQTTEIHTYKHTHTESWGFLRVICFLMGFSKSSQTCGVEHREEMSSDLYKASVSGSSQMYFLHHFISPSVCDGSGTPGKSNLPQWD